MIRSTPQGRAGRTLVTAVAAAIATTAVAVPSAFAQPADPVHTAASDRALAAQGSPAGDDLRTPDAIEAGQSERIAAAPRPVKVVEAAQPSADGFDWGDAAVGAGGALGAVLLCAGGAMGLMRRQRPATA